MYSSSLNLAMAIFKRDLTENPQGQPVKNIFCTLSCYLIINTSNAVLWGGYMVLHRGGGAYFIFGGTRGPGFVPRELYMRPESLIRFLGGSFGTPLTES